MIRPRECTVYVIDDDDAVRGSLRWLMESADHKAIGFSSGEEFIARLPEVGVGCVVTDVRMPGISGIELIREMRRRNCHLPVVVITAHGEVDMAVDAMKLGAYDFVQKPFDEGTLLEVVENALLECHRQQTAAAGDTKVQQCYQSLTPREREVLVMLVAGRANREVAETLNISIKTVEAHRAHIMEKMEVDSFAELVASVVRAGVIPAAPRQPPDE